MTTVDDRTVQVLVPAHNEALAIAATLREFHEAVAKRAGIPISFLVCEDGSTDGTADVVRALASELPIRLINSQERKGYSRAVIDGLHAAEGQLICFIDSDGQCDPADFQRLYAKLDGNDMVIGYRSPRADPAYRRVMSRSFGLVYRLLFPVRLRDPSCPYLLIRREALAAVMTGNLGILKQGFWWEFNARATAAGLRIEEVPVRHRIRKAGNTQVYRLRKIPSIAAKHLLGLMQLRRELAKQQEVAQVRPAL